MKKILCLVFLFLSAAFVNVGFAQGNARDGSFNLDDMDITKVQRAANQGDAPAQTLLGLRYYEGNGVAQSYETAAQWFEKAAIQGDKHAQSFLALLYIQGKGVPKDHTKALYWSEKSAAQGLSMGQYMTGRFYYTGEPGVKDYVKARVWFEKAAVQGNAEAQFYLGLIYTLGEGVKQDNVKARKWFEAAAANGDAKAQFVLGRMYLYGEGVAENLTTAKSWFKRSCDGGYEQACAAYKDLNSAKNEKQEKSQTDKAQQLYEEGILYNKEGKMAQSVKAFEQAANMGYADAQFMLGLMYHEGEGGVKQDYAKARQWFEKAAAQGEAEPAFKLGAMYYKGEGVTRDYAKAREWFGRACKDGKKEGCDLYEGLEEILKFSEEELMYMDIRQYQEKGDYAKAAELLEKLANKGNAHAQYQLGVMYIRGDGVSKNNAKAKKWITQACNGGNEVACFHLKELK